MIQLAIDYRESHIPDSYSDTPLANALKAIEATRQWVDKAVIGLNLCPFAKAVQAKRQIRYAVSNADHPQELQSDLAGELNHLANADPNILDTTILIHPHVLTHFFDYNHFLETADKLIVDLNLSGEIQIASFHPDYQFSDVPSDDITNYTNRSPYPILHLLRESSIERAVLSFPDAADIYQKNMSTLKQLGHAGWLKLGLKPTT